MEYSECQVTDARPTNWQFSHRKNLYYWKIFNIDPDGRDKACSFGEIGVSLSRRIKIKWFSLEFSDYQDYNAKEKHLDFSIDCSCTNAVFSFDMLIEENQFVVAGNWKFEDRSLSTRSALVGRFRVSQI